MKISCNVCVIKKSNLILHLFAIIDIISYTFIINAYLFTKKM